MCWLLAIKCRKKTYTYIHMPLKRFLVLHGNSHEISLNRKNSKWAGYADIVRVRNNYFNGNECLLQTRSSKKKKKTPSAAITWQTLGFFSCISQMFFCLIRRPQTWIHLSTAPSSNLPVSRVCALFPMPVFSYELARPRYGFFFFASSLLILTLVFDRYYLVQLPVEDL